MMLVQPAAALQGPQLSAIRAADPNAAVQAIARLLGYVDGMFNFAEHKKLNTIQASMLANDIAQRYWQLKFDEVVYVFREGANGRYHTFDRIDPGVIHGWFAEYLKERDALVEQLAHNQMIQEKQQRQLDATNAAEYLNGLPQSQAPELNVHRQYLKKRLDTYTDEELKHGITYYSGRANLQDALLKVELCRELLRERETRLQRAQDATKAKARDMLSKFAEFEAQDAESEPIIINPSTDQDGYWKTKDVAKRA